MTRLLAALLAVFFLGLVALMASVTFFVRDPIPVLSARAPVSVQEEGSIGSGLRATVAVDPSMRFEVTGEGARGDSLPALRLERADGSDASLPIDVESAGAGFFQGRGQFTAPGRWRLLVDDDGRELELTFILQE